MNRSFTAFFKTVARALFVFNQSNVNLTKISADIWSFSPPLQLHDEKRVLDCLKKGIKIASQCMDSGTKAQLYVELLNKYVYFYEKGHSGISQEILQEILDRIKSELPNLEAGSDEAEQINKHFDNTLHHLKLRKEDASGDGPSFANLVLN